MNLPGSQLRWVTTIRIFRHDLSASAYYKIYLYLYHCTFHLSMYEQEQVVVMEHQMVVDLEKCWYYLMETKMDQCFCSASNWDQCCCSASNWVSEMETKMDGCCYSASYWDPHSAVRTKTKSRRRHRWDHTRL